MIKLYIKYIATFNCQLRYRCGKFLVEISALQVYILCIQRVKAIASKKYFKLLFLFDKLSLWVAFNDPIQNVLVNHHIHRRFFVFYMRLYYDVKIKNINQDLNIYLITF